MKKNKLLIFILIGLVLGIATGTIINLNIEPKLKKLDSIIEKYNSGKEGSEKSKKDYYLLKEKISAIKKDYKKQVAQPFNICSQIFLLLIKMIIAPLVFSVLVLGIGKISDVRTMGRIGAKTMIYFLCATIVALFIGLVIANIFQPGKHMSLELPRVGAETGIKAKSQTASNFIEHVIPSSVIKSMAENDILPIVVFSVFFGIGVSAIKERGKVILNFCESLSHVMFKVTDYVMKFAPLGIFGAIASVLIQQGPGIMLGYLYLIACFFGGLLFFIFVILFLVCKFYGIPFFKLLSHIKEPLILAFSTASSEAAMPMTIEALEKFGIGNRVVSFVLPLGYSFNLDGSIMYMTFATAFIAQAYGIQMSVADQIYMMLILLLASKGVAGVPRASLVVIAGMLSTFKIPGEGLLLVLAIDQILDMGRSATNVIGNAVASAVIAKSEKEYHRPSAQIKL
ncbi:MAG: dicarboxylate/amino acid:cation symporter [Bacteroidota bacterium]|jgi:Na+/H+-dicarboxylate symporter